MGDLLQPWHLVALAVVAFLLFGIRRLPDLGRGLGEGLRGFREGVRGIFDPLPPASNAPRTTATAPPPAANAPIGPKQG